MTPTMTAVAPSEELATTPTWDPIALTPIASHEQYVDVSDYLQKIKGFQQRVTSWFKPHKDRAYAAHRALCADEAKALAPAQADEVTCKRLMVAWDTEQERIRRERERQLQEQARIDEERRRVDEAAAMELEAASTGDAGLMDEALALLSTPAPAPVVVVASETPKVAGVTFRSTWKHRVTDEKKIPREYLMVDEAKIRRVVAAMKNTITIPGVEIFEDRGISSRSR